MRTINRRELSRNSAAVLDSILATGEPVEVTTQGRESVIISPKANKSFYEQWIEQGLVKPGNGKRLSEAPRAITTSTLAEILEDIGSDH
jgi:PHD/YefM family antitoxin component YafN of YafNO toxin-antitoxin module